MTGPHVYEVTVDGHLDDHWATWLGGVEARRTGDGTTTLVVRLEDAAEVHGVLTGLRDIGATLLSLQTAKGPGPSAADGDGGPAPSGFDRLVTTRRLTLRPATATDADSTWRYRRLPEVGEWLTGTPGTRAEYRRLFAEPERLATTVVVALGHGPGAPVIGDFMVRREDAWAQADVRDRARGLQAELGWVLDPARTGHGYATEAVVALLQHCFADLGVRRVVAGCFLANQASWRLMERVGMRRETHAVRDALHRSGQWLDSVTYALLAEEWGTSERAVHSHGR